MKKYYFTRINSDEKIAIRKAESLDIAIQLFSEMKKLSVEKFLLIYNVKENAE